MIRRLFQPPKLDRWDDYFEPGEVLLWQGGPEPGIKRIFPNLFLSIFGLPFLFGGFMVAGSGLAAFAGMGGLMGLGAAIFLLAFATPFLVAGAGMVFGPWFFAFTEHKFVRYALTNRRAYVARSLLKHTIASYRIHPDDPVTLTQGRFDTVALRTFEGRDSDGDKTTLTISFDGLANGHEVYGLIRQIQKESDGTDNSSQ